jgi:hypothetical protein
MHINLLGDTSQIYHRLTSPKYTNDLHKVKTSKNETQLKFVETH